MTSALAPRIQIRVQSPGMKEPAPFPNERIKEWSFDDDESKADVLKLTINNSDLRFPDDPVFEHGARIFARWGAAGLGPEQECIVQKWPGSIWPDFQIEAHGDGITLNKTKLTEVWTNKKRSDVVAILAERFGFGPTQRFIEDTGEVYDTIQTRGKTPAQLLRAMADRESKNGVPYVYYVDGTGLHFHPRRLEQTPQRSYAFVGAVNGTGGPGRMRSFPTFKASVQAKPGAVSVAGVDPTTGKKVTATASNKDDPGRPGLAPIVLTMDKKSGEIALRSDIASTSTAPTGATTPEEAKKVAGAALAKSSAMPVECTVVVDGDPYLTAKSTVELTKIGTMLSGLYYAKKVVHSGKGGDYTCTITATRDGVNRTGVQGAAAAAAASAAKQNTAKPPDGTGSGAPPELEPKVVIDKQSGTKSYSYVPKTGQSGGK